jgi:hypothetical protein
VVYRWTRWLYHELGAQHHWDLTGGPPGIHVFLLPGWLEVDLTFAPEDQFGPRGPQWRTVFGQPQPLEPFPALTRGRWSDGLAPRLARPDLHRARPLVASRVTDQRHARPRDHAGLPAAGLFRPPR